VDLLRLWALQRRIAAQIDAGGYDVVFVHPCRFGQAPALLQFLGTPSIYYCQEHPRLIYQPRAPRPYARFSTAQRIGNCFDPLPRLYRTLLKALDRRSVDAATSVLTNSAFSRESLYHTYGVFADVCYLGVDLERFRPSGSGRGEYVLSVGALHPLKGFDFLLHSLAALDAGRRPPLVIVSNWADPRERRYLGELAAALGVRVTFRTQVVDAELVQLYQAARLTLYAPIMEPFGFVPLESAACATPVVGVREGGLRETVLHGETGLLVEREHPGFAEAVDGLLRDPPRCEDMGCRARTYVEQTWSWGHSTHNLETFLARAAQQVPRKGVA
jgi:glycosyltransferase involved in cell wall biosynthesis